MAMLLIRGNTLKHVHSYQLALCKLGIFVYFIHKSIVLYVYFHVTKKCVVLTLSIPRYHKPFYGFSQYMCNSVEVVKKCRSGKCFIGLTHCPHLPDLLSDRQEGDFDSSGKVIQMLLCNITMTPTNMSGYRKVIQMLLCNITMTPK